MPTPVAAMGRVVNREWDLGRHNVPTSNTEFLERSFSFTGYAWGCLLLVFIVIFPLAIMGFRSRSVFRRHSLRPPAPFT